MDSKLLSKADIVLKSNNNKNIYFLFKTEIIVCNEGKNEHITITLPKINDRIMCFYDMYYTNDRLCVIVATRDYYDFSLTLNEDTLELCEMRNHK